MKIFIKSFAFLSFPRKWESILIAFAIIFFLIPDSYSQIKLNVKASLSNTFRYGSGYEFRDGENRSKEYLEDLGDARLNINDIVFGVRYEISDPIEYGRDFKGIRKRFIEYTGSDVVKARVGDFWEVISRGMSLNTFEQRPLGYDTGIDGLRVSFQKTFGKKKPVKTKAQIIGGDIQYSDNLNPQRIEEYKIRNINAEISPLKFLTIGTNYVHAIGKIPSSGDTTGIRADIPELYMNFNLGGLQLYGSYVHKTTLVDPNTIYPMAMTAKGDAFYSSLSYSRPGVGVTFEYKNYRFDVVTPDNQSTQRATRMLPFQNPPTAIKEHSWTLVSRNPHVTDFNDEVGAQLEIMLVPNDNMSILINSSIASKHYKYVNTGTGGKIVYTREDRSSSFMPAFNSEFNPWIELYLEVENYFSKKFYAKVAASRQNSVTFTYPKTTEKLLTTTIPVELKYEFIKDYSIKLITEQQWQYNSLRFEDKQNYYNQFVSLSFIKSPDLSITLNSEFTTDEEEATGKKSWFQGEVAYNINTANVVTVSYGSERGGIRCTSGICRYVNPFDGFRITIQSKF